ncbi:MAG TPA: shikimate dehydrogenase [Candidatus Dormibacteraeota bacterium]|jgi:shikimate dehydrogenase
MGRERASTVLLLGDPVGGSLSAALQNAAFDALGIACHYTLRRVMMDELVAVVEEIRASPSILGANVTIPHKEAVLPLLDALDPDATRIGAVNTISRHGRRLTGGNTDAEGFDRALAGEGIDPRGKSVAVLGAGGAARAVVSVLAPRVANLIVVGRTIERAQRLCADLGVRPGSAATFDSLDTVLLSAELVVNATPVDLIPPDSRRTTRVLDLRYRKSAFGLAMLLHQGAASFRIWTGKPPPIDVMRASLDHAAREAAPA